MSRLEKDSDSFNFFPFPSGLVNNLLQVGESHETKALLLKYGYIFSEESVRNLEIALSVYKTLELPEDSIFFVYGSTARGKAVDIDRLQEIQFWEGERFCGSCFRRLGGSDIDLRAIIPNREQILPSVEKVKQTLRTIGSTRVELRIDDPSYPIWEATRSDVSSFYRRLLLFSRPIVLHGKTNFDAITELAISHFSDDDYVYETQRKDVKACALRETELRPFIYWGIKHLRDSYPLYYSSQTLSGEGTINFPPPLKISLVKGESSLVIARISEDRIKQFLAKLEMTPKAPAKELVDEFKEG